jgi:integrase
MPRKLKNALIDTPTARRRLSVSGNPYFCRLGPGVHFGYRKGETGGAWVMRWRTSEGNYKSETIGTADDGAVAADGIRVFNFSQAEEKARKLFTLRSREQGGLPAESGPYSVRACIEEYLQWMESARKSTVDSRHRANALILPVLGEKPCATLTTSDLERWRDATANAPRRLRTATGKRQNYRVAGPDDEAIRRRRSSTNRTLTILKAALNRAWRAGKIASDDAWRRLTPYNSVDSARSRYLAIAEAKRLMDAAEPSFGVLVRAALSSGARYSELAALKVADFNPDSGTLHIRTSKSGKGRHVVLADEGSALFASLATNRPGEAPMLTKSNGSQWRASHQARPMREACARAQIAPAASFHCLRHTYASHSIMNGAPLFVVAKNLGHADTRMVERHYGHLAPSFIAGAIRAAAPRFVDAETAD